MKENNEKLNIEPPAKSEDERYRSLDSILKDAYERSALTDKGKRNSQPSVLEKDKVK